MRLRGRLDRLTKRMGADSPPLTVVLVEASAERPVDRRGRTNAAGLPVVEIAVDPNGGPVHLPDPPYKLVAGTDPVDLV